MLQARMVFPLGVVAALAAAAGGTVAAQTATGTVVDAGSGRPVPAALVSLLRDGAAVASEETDSAGSFRIRVLQPGDYALRVESLGFEAHELTIELRPAELVTLRVLLGARPVELDPIAVTGRMRRGAGTALEGFHEREYWMGERLGIGHFFGQEKIESINPMGVTDLLKTLPGVRLIPANVNGTYDIRLGPGDCSPKIYLDGVWWNRWATREEAFTGITLRTRPPSDQRLRDAGADRNADVDLLLSPSMLAGIEVYRRGSQLPAEFADGEARAFRCGVIALWSKRGG